MDLRQLHMFCEVVRQGSFTRAAERLMVAQPAVSMAMRKLEGELEVTLLNRQGRRVVPTAEGEVLLRHAETMLEQQHAAETEMAELRGLTRGEVRVGIPPMMGSYYFPRLIRNFRQQYPGLSLAVHGDGAARIQQMIARGEIDMGVIVGPHIPDGLHSRIFLREEVVACLPADHPLAGDAAITMEQFVAQPLVLFREGYYMREWMDEVLRDRPHPAHVVLETNLFSLVRSLVREGLGISTLLQRAVVGAEGLAALSFAPPLYLELHIAWKEDGHLSGANRAFIDFLLQWQHSDGDKPSPQA